MNKIKVFTDSASDLPKPLAEHYDIDVLPLYITLGEKTFLDDGALTCGDLFRFVDENNILPKTAAVNVSDFVRAFQPWLDKGYDIVMTTISADLSSTYQSAGIAAAELNAEDRIYLIDSRSLSSGISLVALRTAELRDQGKSAKEIKSIAEEMIVPNISASFFVTQLDYLYKGGRCSKLSAFLGTTLKLAPQLVLIDGKIVPGEKYRGSWEKVCDQYFASTIGSGKNIDKSRVFITHTAPDKAEKRAKIARDLTETYGFLEVIDNFAGATITSHCGPGTLGVLFIRE